VTRSAGASSLRVQPKGPAKSAKYHQLAIRARRFCPVCGFLFGPFMGRTSADSGDALVTWGGVFNVLGLIDTLFQTDLVNTLEIALVGGDAAPSVSAEEMLAGVRCGSERAQSGNEVRGIISAVGT
jgi:hypothetical protein